MAEYVAKYADGRGQIHQQVIMAASEGKFAQKRSKSALSGSLAASRAASRSPGFSGRLGRRGRNAQSKFQSAVAHADRLALPILKGLDLPAYGFIDWKPGRIIRAVRDELKKSKISRQDNILRKI